MLEQLKAQLAAALDAAYAEGKSDGHAQGLSDAAAPLLALESSLHESVAAAKSQVEALIAGGGEQAAVPASDAPASDAPSA